MNDFKKIVEFLELMDYKDYPIDKIQTNSLEEVLKHYPEGIKDKLFKFLEPYRVLHSP